MGQGVLSRRQAAGLLAAAFGAPLAARAEVLSPDPGEIHGRLDDLARLTAPVTINGRGPFRFVMDTGSNHSLIADDLARALDLPPARPLLVNTVAGAQMTPAVTAGTVQVGALVSRDVMLGHAPRAAIGGAGLLGIDRLSALRLTLDFRRRRLAIGPSGRRLRDGEAFTVRARQRSGRLTLVGAQVGDAPVTAFLDSGSEVTIGNLALRRRLGPQVRPIQRDGEAAPVPVIGATGLEAMGELGLLPTLRMGGLQVYRLPAVFADLHTFRVWGMADEPALLIGVDLLSRFETVDLDFGRAAVLFRVPGRTAAQGTRLGGESSTGLQILRQGS